MIYERQTVEKRIKLRQGRFLVLIKITDLMVKFDRQALIGYLEAGERLLTISGALNGGTRLQGSDTIRVIH